MGLIRDAIFLILFIVLLCGWLLAWVAFHLTAGGIHILLVLAVLFLIIHFVRGRRVA